MNLSSRVLSHLIRNIFRLSKFRAILLFFTNRNNHHEKESALKDFRNRIQLAPVSDWLSRTLKIPDILWIDSRTCTSIQTEQHNLSESKEDYKTDQINHLELKCQDYYRSDYSFPIIKTISPSIITLAQNSFTPSVPIKLSEPKLGTHSVDNQKSDTIQKLIQSDQEPLLKDVQHTVKLENAGVLFSSNTSEQEDLSGKLSTQSHSQNSEKAEINSSDILTQRVYSSDYKINAEQFTCYNNSLISEPEDQSSNNFSNTNSGQGKDSFDKRDLYLQCGVRYRYTKDTGSPGMLGPVHYSEQKNTMYENMDDNEKTNKWPELPLKISAITPLVNGLDFNREQKLSDEQKGIQWNVLRSY